MQELIKQLITASIHTKQQLLGEAFVKAVAHIATNIKRRSSHGGTIYACGNGGSTCDAMHFVEELVARFKRDRPGIKAMHFMDPSVLTCWSNDYTFDGVFERQAFTFCTDKDVLVLLSTSGNSENVCRAAVAAKKRGTYTVALTGKDGGRLASIVDDILIIPSQQTERIQETHIMVIHILCELLETE